MPQRNFMHLVSGQRYAVVSPFTDFDRVEHAVGETWTYVGSSFLPYEDGLSLFVEIGTSPHHIRMQWRDKAQGPIIDRLKDYVQEIK